MLILTKIIYYNIHTRNN